MAQEFFDNSFCLACTKVTERLNAIAPLRIIDTDWLIMKELPPKAIRMLTIICNAVLRITPYVQRN